MHPVFRDSLAAVPVLIESGKTLVYADEKPYLLTTAPVTYAGPVDHEWGPEARRRAYIETFGRALRRALRKLEHADPHQGR